MDGGDAAELLEFRNILIRMLFQKSCNLFHPGLPLLTSPKNHATYTTVVHMRDERRRHPSYIESQGDIDFQICFYKSIIDNDPTYVDALALLGEAYTRKGLYEEGLTIDRRITDLKPNDPIAFYNLACSYSLVHRSKEALQCLRRSIALGYSDLEHIASDQDLASLHSDRSFHRLIRRICRRILKNLRGTHHL